MAITLTDSELNELRELIDTIDHRLSASNYQMLSTAKHGSRLSPTNSSQLIVDKELLLLKRIRELLGLPLGNRPSLPAAAEPASSLREDMAHQGVEHSSQRNKRTAAEREARNKRNSGSCET